MSNGRYSKMKQAWNNSNDILKRFGEIDLHCHPTSVSY